MSMKLRCVALAAAVSLTASLQATADDHAYSEGPVVNVSRIRTVDGKFDDYLGQISKDKARPVIVYCALGSSSTAVVEKLRKAGVAEVYPLRGGVNAWAAANLPLTTK